MRIGRDHVDGQRARAPIAIEIVGTLVPDGAGQAAGAPAGGLEDQFWGRRGAG